MKPNEMIARYIFAVTRHLPEKMREDVKLELQSIISDMLEQRCGDLVPAEQDVRLVLTELGTPWELEAKYRPEGATTLLGGAYYQTWKLVMKIVLLCFGFGMTVAFGVQFFTEQPVWYEAFAKWLGSLLSGGMTAFGFVTLLFMIFQQKQVPMMEGKDFLDELPPVPDKKLTIPTHEAVIELVLHGVFVLVFLAFPQFIVGIFDGGEVIPAFNLAVLRGCWPFIIGIAALGILVNSMELLEGRHTKRLVAVSVVAELITIALSGLWLFTPNLINSTFLRALSGLFSGEAFLIRIFANIPQLLFGFIAFSSLLEIGMKLWKLRYLLESKG